MDDKQDIKSQTADILVVDDTIASLRLLTEILIKEGYQVRPTDRSKLALQSALANPPSLILLDVRMPEMSGFEVCRRLKQDEQTRDIPIIFISALQDIEDRVQGFDVGGVDFISKPIEEAEVLARVKTHLQLHEMQFHLEALVADRTADLKTANRALHESEEQFQSTFEQAAVGIAHVAPDGRYLRLNQKFCDIVGYSPEEMQARTFQDITHPDDLDIDLENVQRLLDGEDEIYSLEKRYLSKNREIVWVNLTVSLVRSSTGKPRYFISVIEDITERRQAQEAVRISEEKFNKVFHSSPAALTVTHLETGVFFDVNQSFERDFGYSREEIIGKSSLEINIWKNPADRERLMPIFLQQRSLHVDELELLRKSGETIIVDVSFSLIQIEDVDFSVALFINITERVRSERLIADQKELLENTLESLAYPFYVINAQDYSLILANSVAKQLSESDASTCHALTHQRETPCDGAEHTCPLMEVKKTGKPVRVEHLHLGANGEKSFFEVYGYPIFDADGDIVQMIEYSLDITERKIAEYTLEESEEKYRTLVEQAQDGIVVLQDNKIQLANPRAEKLFGYASKELLNTVFTAYIHPDELTKVTDNYRRRMNGEPVPSVYESAVLHKDGSRAEVEFNAGLTLYNGKPADLVMIHDITERKQAEQNILEYQGRLIALASQLTIAEERERRRIAVELHDHVGQSLALARIQLAAARDSSSEDERNDILNAISQNLLLSIQETRSLVFDLSSPVLKEFGLGAAITNYLKEQVEQRHGLRTVFTEHELKVPLTEDVRAILFRNVRELLNNVVRHANASQVRVRLDQDEEWTTIIIEDDGIGFDPEKISGKVSREGVFGLFSIQERMNDLGGSLKIISEPGKGSRVILLAPLGDLQS